MNKTKLRPTGKAWCVLESLLLDEGLSTMEQVDRCNTTRPGSIVHHLRKSFQVPIETSMRAVYREGKIIRYAVCRIAPAELEAQQKRFGFEK